MFLILKDFMCISRHSAQLFFTHLNGVLADHDKETLRHLHDQADTSAYILTETEYTTREDCLTLKAVSLLQVLDLGRLSTYIVDELTFWQLCMHDAQVFPSGFVINSNNCQLGCSPDAKLVVNKLYGIGESKCPEQFKNCDIFDAAKSSIIFILYVSDEGKLEICKSHSSFYQIQ